MELGETRKLFAEHPVVRRFGHSRLDAHISRLARMIFDVPPGQASGSVQDLARAARSRTS
jgi:hypothetical protein